MVYNLHCLTMELDTEVGLPSLLLKPKQKQFFNEINILNIILSNYIDIIDLRYITLYFKFKPQ